MKNTKCSMFPTKVGAVIIVAICLCACSSAEVPVVRPAPTFGAGTFQLTDAPMGDSVIAIATAPPTPTPDLTDSGLLIYDNFNTDGDLDPERWQGQLHHYSIQGGVLTVSHSSNSAISTVIQANSRMLWEIRDEGETRFSVESRILSPAERYDSQSGLVSGIQLEFTDNVEYFFQIGYMTYWDSNAIHCQFGYSEDGVDYIQPTFTSYAKWHILRIDISEIPNRTFFQLNGYMDGVLVCSGVPPSAFQESMRQRNAITINLYHDFSGIWDQEQPLIVQYDYIAVSPP